ncbi:MAG: sigma-54 interaction domain-containing protein [Bacillota bacterium]
MSRSTTKEKKKAVESYSIAGTKNVTSPDLLKGGIIASSPQMREVLKLAGQVASTDCTVILLGESGVGKDVIARYIHEKGPRAASPFIKVNCGAIPETLLESELFGYERGAFTGANREGKVGKFEQAKNGTIFLDEVGDLPLPLQVKLLHVLQEHEIVRVGGSLSRQIDARVVAATNRNLKEMVSQGKFREDLYFRLNVIPIQIPPLRRRKEDIIPLVMHFKQKYEKKYNICHRCTPDLLQTFQNYDWPGNVRELENTIERIYVMISNDKLVTPDILVKYGLGLDLGTNSQAPAVTVHRIATLREIMDEAEGQLLAMAMEKYRGIKEIALALGVDQSTVSRKLKSLREKRMNFQSGGDENDQ